MIQLLKCEMGCRRETGSNDEDKFVFHNVIKKLDDTIEAKCKTCGFESKRTQEEVGDVHLGGFSGARAQLTKYPYIEPQSGVMVKSAQHRVDVWKQMGFRPADPKEKLK